jgi:hypothetical protein
MLLVSALILSRVLITMARRSGSTTKGALDFSEQKSGGVGKSLEWIESGDEGLGVDGAVLAGTGELRMGAAARVGEIETAGRKTQLWVDCFTGLMLTDWTLAFVEPEEHGTGLAGLL